MSALYDGWSQILHIFLSLLYPLINFFELLSSVMRSFFPLVANEILPRARSSMSSDLRLTQRTDDMRLNGCSNKRKPWVSFTVPLHADWTQNKSTTTILRSLSKAIKLQRLMFTVAQKVIINLVMSALLDRIIYFTIFRLPSQQQQL